MSTQNKTDLEIRVIDVDRREIENATVLIPGVQGKPLGRGRFVFPGLRAGRVQIRVEASGLSPVELSTDVSGSRQRLDVVLGEPGLPTLRRRSVAVPFRSPENRLGVITRGPEGAAALESSSRRLNVGLERPHGRDLTIIICSPEQRDKVAAEIRRLPTVKDVGRLVNPSSQGTGILTRNIVVRARPGTNLQAIEAAATKLAVRFVASSPSRTGGYCP